MNRKNLIIVLLLAIILNSACSLKHDESNNSAIKITVLYNKDIALHPLSKDALISIKADSLSPKQMQQFFSVYLEPDDEEMRDLQPPLAGNYLLTDTSFVFKPEQKLMAGNYFAVCYIKQFVDPIAIIQSHRLPGREKPLEQKFKIR